MLLLLEFDPIDAYLIEICGMADVAINNASAVVL